MRPLGLRLSRRLVGERMNDPKSSAGQGTSTAGETAVGIINPPNFLKNKVRIAPGLLEDVLARADKLIAALQGEFAAGTEIRIQKLADVYQQWRLPETREAAIRDFRRLAHDLKGEAGTFGYDLITDIADLFGDYLRETPTGRQTAEAVKSYVDTFQMVWSQRITGDGGEAGRQMIAGLSKLNEGA